MAGTSVKQLCVWWLVSSAVAAYATTTDVTERCSESEGDQCLETDQYSFIQTQYNVAVIRELEAFVKQTPGPVVATGRGSNATLSPSAAAAGVTLNSHGDLPAFVTAFLTNIVFIGVMIGLFTFLRYWKPTIYLNGAMPKESFPADIDSTFGWVGASWRLRIDESTVKHIGLDMAMLLQFTELCMKICWTVGIPMVVIMGPVHFFLGGKAAGNDYLSYFSMGNVANGSWLYWIHALIVWCVVYTVKKEIYSAQNQFLTAPWGRQEWLKNMPAPRATTVMVEGIQENHQSDQALQDFFGRCFSPGKIKCAYVVKKTAALVAAVEKKKCLEHSQFESQSKFDRDGNDKHKRNVEKYSSEIDVALAEIMGERTRIKEKSGTVGGVHSESGFVTFVDRRDAEIAKSLQYDWDSDVLVVSTPPSPETIIWKDLQQSSTVRTGREAVGYLLVAGLYLAYMPLVVGITRAGNMVELGGSLQALWAGFAPTVGLTVMVSFLPTFLIWIFRIFFVLGDSAWEQHKLCQWYFVFQVVFVILITAMGPNVWVFMDAIMESPFSVFGLFGATMPLATHFYMNFLVLAWVTHFWNMTRMSQFCKFMFFSRLWDEAEARKMAEPEDQDYYGIGSRSARFTINMLIGIIFGTLSPPIMLLTYVNFWICRLCYGYLIPFAECRKPDLGGAFWVSSLNQLFVGLHIYCVVMIGVLYGRAANAGPMFLAAPSLVMSAYFHYKFSREYMWERLPYAELIQADRKDSLEQAKEQGSYVQPELVG